MFISQSASEGLGPHLLSSPTHIKGKKILSPKKFNSLILLKNNDSISQTLQIPKTCISAQSPKHPDKVTVSVQVMFILSLKHYF